MINNSMIPDEGTDLQCGSCNHVCFYKIEKQNNEVLKLHEEIESKVIDEEVHSLANDKTEIKNELKETKSEKPKNKTTSKKTENKESKFFSYLIVFIISFVALIILLDTLKTPLINVFPGLEIILFNLFETLQDIKLFIIDLI